MKNTAFLTMTLGALFAFQACTDSKNNNGRNTETDSTAYLEDISADEDTTQAGASTFFMKAADAGMAEVEFGKLARDAAKNQDVKDFAAQMVKDHTKANEELKALATSKNVQLSPVISNVFQGQLTDLSSKTGDAFDKQYMDLMMVHHMDAIKLFEETSKNETDPEVKAFAAKTLPVLKAHHQKAEPLAKKYKQEQTMGNPSRVNTTN
jgi:putative membrane protein